MPLIEDIYKKRLDMLVGDVQFASTTVSTLVRTMAIGLAIMIYGFVFSKDVPALFLNHKGWFLVSSICGILALALDVWQYQTLTRLAQRRLNHLMELAHRDGKIERLDQFLSADSDPDSDRIGRIFKVKIALVLIGCAIVAGVVLTTFKP